ncbi:MAG: LysE family transporter [Methanosarcinaceae archaeon]|nr:LysE family transporter [Methanosarcinaceae archaeon]
MLEILNMLLVGFTVGLSGALVPGPMLFATIETSLKNGWLAGPSVVMGHAVLEFAICVLVVLGMTSLVGSSVISAISVIGGVFLIIFGLMTIKGASDASEAFDTSSGITSSPVTAGLITSVSNPYFWLWWITAGSALVLKGLEIGILAAVFFVIGHWLADLCWYCAVSVSFSRGKTLMSHATYKWILTACGVFLILFGGWFVLD